MSEHQLVRELRDRDVAEAWLAAGIGLSRLTRPDPDELVTLAPWLLGTLSEAGNLPPAGVVADIGHLLTGRSLRAVQPLPAMNAELRDAVSSYEDHLLGRLEADPRMDEVTDAIASLPAEQRDPAIALFCVHLLARIGYDAGVALGPGIARRVLHKPLDDIVRLGHAAMTEAGLAYEALVAGYRSASTAARRMGSLIGEPEVFLMENFGALGELTHRMAIEQMIEVTEALSASLPRRLKPRPRNERGFIPTPLAAEDNYPTGGFAALSTSGSIENLVISELIYMNDESTDDIDLFDLRYAEGDLLYYTRDESVFVRSRRTITFVLLPDLVAARFKDSELRWQRLIVVFGLIACCVRWLARSLEGEGLLFRVVFVPTQSFFEPLAAERGLCTILLREWIARQMAEVTVSSSLDELLASASQDARGAESDVIVFAARSLELQPIPGVLLGSVDVGEPVPVLSWGHRSTPDRTGEDADAGADSGARHNDLWQAWMRTTLELLQEIL